MTPFEEIGPLMREVMEAAIARDTNLKQETRRALQRCLPHLENALESWCPMAFMKTRDGVAIAYGPGETIPGGKHVCIATSTRAHMIGIEGWAPIEKRDVDAAGYWGMIFKAMEQQDAETAMKALCVLRNRNRAGFDAKEAEFEASGELPVTIALVAVNSMNNRAGGIITVVPFPASIATQLENVEARDHNKGR